MTTEAVTEEEKMRRVPGIIFVDGTRERVARIAGTGLEVFEIIQAYREGCRRDLRCLRESFHWLSEDQLQAALAYYRAFPEEIGPIIDENVAAVPEDVRREWEEYVARMERA